MVQARELLPSTEDVGWQMIHKIHRTLNIDEEWTEWHEDGFTWWSYAHAQRLRFEGPFDVDGIPTTWITFETEVLRNVPNDDQIVRAVVAADNRLGNLFEAAIVDGRMVYRGRTYALPETADSRVKLVADRAIIANILAHRRAADLADLMQHRVARLRQVEAAVSAHPTSGLRAVPDDMLNVVDRIHVPHGRLPAPPYGAPSPTGLAQLAERLGIETKISDDEKSLFATIRVGSRPFELELTYKSKHPVLGSGLLSLLSLPRGFDAGGVTGQALADRLNEAEWVTRTPLVTSAAWVTASDSDPKAPPRTVHAVFYPNLSLAVRAADCVLSDAIQRVRWVSLGDNRAAAA